MTIDSLLKKGRRCIPKSLQITEILNVFVTSFLHCEQVMTFTIFGSNSLYSAAIEVGKNEHSHCLMIFILK